MIQQYHTVRTANFEGLSHLKIIKMIQQNRTVRTANVEGLSHPKIIKTIQQYRILYGDYLTFI